MRIKSKIILCILLIISLVAIAVLYMYIVRNSHKDKSQNLLSAEYLIQHNFPQSIKILPILQGKENLIKNGDFRNGFSNWEPYKTIAAVGKIASQIWIDDKAPDTFTTQKTTGKTILTLTKPDDTQILDIKFDQQNNKTGLSNLYISEGDGAILSNALEIKKNADFNYLSLYPNKSAGHTWIHQRCMNSKPGKIYILSVNYLSYPYNSEGEICIGEYGGSASSIFKKITANKEWQRIIIPYKCTKDYIDILLYAYSEQPIIFENIELYELSEQELSNCGVKKQSDLESYYSKIQEYIENQILKNNSRISETKLDNIYNFGLTNQISFSSIFENQFKSWFKLPEVNSNNDKKINKEFRKKLLSHAQKATPLLEEYHPGLTSKQYMLLYINYMVNANLSINKPDGISRKGLSQNLKFLECECWRASIYVGQLYNIIFGDTANIANTRSHTVLSGDGFIMDSNYNVMFLFDAKDLAIILKLPVDIRRDYILENTIYGYPRLLVNPKVVLHRTADEVKQDYNFQMNLYRDKDKSFPFYLNSGKPAVFAKIN